MTERPSRWTQKDLVAEIERVAKELGTIPSRMSRAEFLSNAKGILTEHDLREYGGYRCIVAANLSEGGKDLKTVHGQRNHISYVRKLERSVGSMESFHEKLTKDLSEVLSISKNQVTNLNAKETKRFLGSLINGKGGSESRSVVTLWSDQHFGTNVNPGDLGGKNSYNWDIAARRLGKLVDQVATYKVEKRDKHEELVILLDGDNIGGIIHNQEGPDYDLMVFQICGTTYYYKQAISFLLQFFPKIRVVCQPGNHGRVMHKMSKDRAIGQKYDSFENVIFYSLSSVFSGNKKVSFEVSRAPFSDVRIQGHRVYLTHGDTVFKLGNVANNVRMASLELQVNRINAEELTHGNGAYELFCLGHVHHPMVTELSNGTRIAINGSLIGMDSYTLGIGVQGSSPSQLVWEATEKFVQGDVRIVNVRDADTQKRYEGIIHPYRYELKE